MLTKTKKQAELSKIFLKAFLYYYHYYKKACAEPLNISKSLDDVKKGLEFECNHIDTTTLEQLAQILGNYLREFLALMEYELPRPDQDRNSAEIIALTRSIAYSLKILGKSVRATFIQRRVEKIAQEHAGKLTKQQQELYTQIAAIFKTA